MSRRLASFLVPVLAIVALLYRGLGAADISVRQPAALVVVGAGLALATMLGLIAAFGGDGSRVLVLCVTTVLLLDVTVKPSRLFAALEEGAAERRDARRVADLHQIKTALDAYIRDVGRLPQPVLYGEGTGPATFWEGWWDVSSSDKNGNGRLFLDFLEERGVHVPVDPLNSTEVAADPRSGNQYVYFVAPPGYQYQGGACEAWRDRGVYLLAITDLELETARPPQRTPGSGCECLWQHSRDFFQRYFDYVLCGTFPQ